MSTSTYIVKPVVKEDESTIVDAPKKDHAINYSPSHKRTDSISPVKDNVENTDSLCYIPNETGTQTIAETVTEPMDTSIPKETVTETTSKPMDTSIPDEPISDEETADNTCNESQFVEEKSANVYCDRPIYEYDSDRDCP